MKEIATQIFYAWEQGERTGNYELFKSFLSNKFTLFSHPLIGKFEKENALTKIENLISVREKTSNNLVFSNVEVFENKNTVSFHFNSKGTVQGGAFPYEGFNIINLQFENIGLIGFQEYFGSIDPNWFKN